MLFDIHLHLHDNNGVLSDRAAVLKQLSLLLGKAEIIMKTQAEIIQQLKDAAVRQAKTIAEIGVVQGTVTELNAKVVELQALIEAAGTNVSQELVDAAQAVADLATQADDQLPDVSVIPPVEPI